MKIKVAALDMIQAPNIFSYIDDNKWAVKGANATVLWGQLFIMDSLSLRRYIPAVGATLQLTFLRADVPGTNTSRTLNKLVTFSSDDRSLFSLSLSSSEIDGIVSGGVTFKLTEGASVQTWIQDWAIRKENVTTGC